MRKLLQTALTALTLLTFTSPAEAAVRHALQSDVYGHSLAQRSQVANLVNTARDSVNVNELFDRTVDPARVLRGQTMLFGEVDIPTVAAGQRIIDSARQWADGRATDVV